MFLLNFLILEFLDYLCIEYSTKTVFQLRKYIIQLVKFLTAQPQQLYK